MLYRFCLNLSIHTEVQAALIFVVLGSIRQHIVCIDVAALTWHAYILSLLCY